MNHVLTNEKRCIWRVTREAFKWGRSCILPKQDTVFLNPTDGELLDAYIEKIKEQRFYKNYLRYSVEEKPKDKNLTDHQEQKLASKSKPILREYFAKMLLSGINDNTFEDFRDQRQKNPDPT